MINKSEFWNIFLGNRLNGYILHWCGFMEQERLTCGF